MRFQIQHRNAYRYSAPVFLEPQTLRMRPRCDWRQSCPAYALEISPSPAGRARNLDLHGNLVEEIWFEGLTGELTLTARSEVITREANPYDFILPAWAETIPFPYPDAEQRSLQPFLNPPAPSPSVLQLAQACVAEADARTLHFPSLLSNRLYHEINYLHRPEGDSYPPEETLARREGACRDLAVLFTACARAVGLAARFVTGYHDPGDREPELHAWAEVYLPGGGWRGFDPSSGLAITERHISLAAAPEPSAAATLTGTSRREASHILETGLSITALPD